MSDEQEGCEWVNVSSGTVAQRNSNVNSGRYMNVYCNVKGSECWWCYAGCQPVHTVAWHYPDIIHSFEFVKSKKYPQINVSDKFNKISQVTRSNTND